MTAVEPVLAGLMSGVGQAHSADHAYVLENGAIAGEGTGAALLESPLVRESYLGL